MGQISTGMGDLPGSPGVVPIFLCSAEPRCNVAHAVWVSDVLAVQTPSVVAVESVARQACRRSVLSRLLASRLDIAKHLLALTLPSNVGK